MQSPTYHTDLEDMLGTFLFFFIYLYLHLMDGHATVLSLVWASKRIDVRKCALCMRGRNKKKRTKTRSLPELN